MSIEAMPRPLSTGWRHRAWWVVAITLGALIAASTFRSSTGVLMEPLQKEFGWSRAGVSGAISLNLLFYGITAPFAAAIMERFSVRRTVTGALVLVGVGSALTTVMSHIWQLWILWGLFIGVGAGSMALVFGAIVANRWFTTHRGLVTGIFSAASALGQLAFLPLIASTVETRGWRYAAGGVAVLALALAPLVWFVLRDHPSDVGAVPYGSTPEDALLDSPEDAMAVTTDVPAPPIVPSVKAQNPAQVAISTLKSVSTSWPFWMLAGSFFVCGWTTNGLIQSHFVPAAHDHGMPATTAASLLAVVGVFDVVGTIGSGWLTDRVDARLLLAIYYSFRGVSLLLLPAVWGPSVEPAMWMFIIFYGLDWVATVPPTVALCRQQFGVERSGIVFGWVFGSHMIGAAAGASAAGIIRQMRGDYRLAWYIAGALCFAAAAAVMTISRRRAPATLSTVGI